MALTQTNLFYTVADDTIQAGPHGRLRRFGPDDPDSFLAAQGEWSLWEDVPTRPNQYHDIVRGTPTTNSGAATPRVERVDTLRPWTAQEIRDAKNVEMETQVPIVTVTDEVRDNTVRAQIEQLELKRKTTVEELAQMPDEPLQSLVDFNPDISARAAAEAEYAANLVAQETRNLTTDSEMVNSGNGGLYTATERTEIRARIKSNAEVARGEKTGVQEPSVGAQRGDVALEDEVRAEASFYEVQFEWASQTYRIPRAVLKEIPAGVTVAQVFGMVYDANNVYLAWLPFEQQPDGTWQTPADASRIPPARVAEGNWRMAISYKGTSAPFEITRRVHIIPPKSTWSWVRWGGRTIATARV